MPYILLIALLVLTYFSTKEIEQTKKNELLDKIKILSKKSYKIERFLVTKFPIFEGYLTKENRNKLRQYLLHDHLNLAISKKLVQVRNDKHLRRLSLEQKLIRVTRSKLTNFYFYNVREKYRFLTPNAHKALILITKRFQEYSKDFEIPFHSKFAVSSIIRPLTKQEKLRKKNINASYVSSHSYGNSFDIFYDDFFIDIWPEMKASKDTFTNLDSLKKRIGFMMGDSLRRQLKTILMRTLIKLQEEGKIYAIIETNQKCFHVSAR